MTLEELCRKHTNVVEDGFAMDLTEERDAWDAAIRAAGRKNAYTQLAECLSALFREKYGREFLYSVPCMAFEIQFHADAYLNVTVGGYPRHIATLPFSKAKLEEHCGMVNISTYDMQSLRQRVIFGYRRGIRPCYRGTAEDPYRRLFRGSR